MRQPKRSPQAKPQRKQLTPDDLIAELMGFLRSKFYAGHPVSFGKDRHRLLEWVILWPATWLDERGVTLPPARYRQIFLAVFSDAIRFGKQQKITYLPAYLMQIIQSHFAMHGDEYYEEGKATRYAVEAALRTAASAIGRQPDPVRQLATAHKFLVSLRKPSRLSPKPPVSDQLSLL